MLECSVCQGAFDTRKAWLSHLLQPYHQSKARKQICRWNQSKRDCALVAYSSLPIASLEILQFFSKGTKGSMDLVTDFVWFDTRPKVGCIRFESKHKIDEILSRFVVPEIRVNNQLVEVKRAVECLQLEWQELIPFPFEEFLEDSVVEQDWEPNRPIDIIINNNTNIPIIIGRREKPDPAPFLSTQYDLICQEIEISDEEFNKAQRFLKMLQIELARSYPYCQVVLFRNWYLQLKSTSATDDELIFFIDQKGNYGNHLTDIITDFTEFPVMDKEKVSELFRTFPHLNVTPVTDKSYKGKESFVCQTNGLKLSVMKAPSIFLPEVQTCRLLAYFCSFDSRVKPLLTVIRFWAKVNGILLAKPNELYFKRAPDPAALDWLVIFFLCNKMKILPTPREINERPHPKLSSNYVDIGFVVEPSFARQFSNRYKESNEQVHFLNVFTLANLFFKFYSNELSLGTGRKVILDTRNGKIIPREEYVPESRSIQKRKVAAHGLVAPIPADIRIHLLHPLFPAFGFSFCDKNFVTSVCPAMQSTGKKLTQALDLYKRGHKFDIKSVLQVIG